MISCIAKADLTAISVSERSCSQDFLKYWLPKKKKKSEFWQEKRRLPVFYINRSQSTKKLFLQPRPWWDRYQIGEAIETGKRKPQKDDYPATNPLGRVDRQRSVSSTDWAQMTN